MAKVRVWRTSVYSSGTVTVVDSVTATFPAETHAGDTLLRTIAGCSVTAFGTHDPLALYSGHSQLMLHLYQSTGGEGPDGGWPYPGTASDSIMSVPLMPTASTVIAPYSSTAPPAEVALHFGHTPEGADSKAQRKITADFSPLWWYVGGAENSPQSGLAMGLRLWVKQLFEYEA